MTVTKDKYNPEELAELLNNALRDRSMGATDDTTDPLVETALRLTQETHPEPSAMFAERVKNRLISGTSRKSHPRRNRILFAPILRRALPLVASFIVVMLIFVIPTAASASVPGDLLYPVKRLIENMQLSVAGSQAQAGIYLRHANTRAEEALILLERDDLSTALIEETLTNMENAATALHDNNQTPTTSQLIDAQQIDSLLNRIVTTASEQSLIDDATWTTLSSEIEDTREAIQILLPDAAHTPADENEQGEGPPESVPLGPPDNVPVDLPDNVPTNRSNGQSGRP